MFYCRCFQAINLAVDTLLAGMAADLEDNMAADSADRPPPKPISHLAYIVSTHHINFQQNQTTLTAHLDRVVLILKMLFC